LAFADVFDNRKAAGPARHPRQPAAQEDGGDYYWNVDLLKSRTLWQAVLDRGWTCAAVTWPVTVAAPITFNLPEYFLRRQGGDMDLLAVDQKSTPGLVREISHAIPSFPQQWVDDRTHTLAVVYLLQQNSRIWC
jgi:hypothetical protein